MDKKIKFAFAHPMREQLARLFTSLSGLELVETKSCKIKQNKKQFKEGIKDKFDDYINKKAKLSLIQKIQKYFGLINFRKYYIDGVDLLVASNGFLFTNKPYVLYLEKATAIFGYNANHYYKPWIKFFLKNRLRDKNLKLIIFRTKTAREGFLNTYKGKDDEIYNLINEKSIFTYPPNPYKPSDKILQRFKNIKIINLFFSSSSFILKGGYQLVRAFDKLSKKYNNLKLFLLTKENTIDKESLEIIKNNKNIELYEPSFSQEELYKNFYLKSHIFVYPTFFDSFGMVINEAISTYTPVISSNFFSIPERIINGKNGFLYESPYKNYNKNKVIFEEGINILSYIYKNSINGKFDYIEKFLYEKIEYFINNPNKLYEFAKKQKEVYENILSEKEKLKEIERILKNKI